MKLREQEAKSKEQPSIDPELAKKDPISFLEKVGLTPEDIILQLTQSDDSSPLTKKSLQDMLDNRFQQEEKAREKARLEAEQAATEQKIELYKSKLSEHVSNDPERWELVNILNAQEKIYDTLKQYYDKTNKELSWDDAADLVEDDLYKQYNSIFSKSKRFTRNSQPQNKQPSLVEAQTNNTQSNRSLNSRDVSRGSATNP